MPDAANSVPFPGLDDYDASDGVRPPRMSLSNMDGGPVPLGYNHDVHYYLSIEKRQILELTTSEHTEGKLRGLASFSWYSKHFGRNSKPPNWKIVAETLIRLCEKAGIYSADRIRGRGFHHDRGSIVLHLGDRLLVDGQEYGPGHSPIEGSRLIYEASEPLDLDLHDPLTDDEARAYFDLVNRCSWGGGCNDGVKEQAILACGWAVIAPICGILTSRPPLYVTGESGSGKTWLLDELLYPAIGPMLLKVGLKTTEAGLRRELHPDALPVAINEAEARDPKSSEMMQRIVELSRASYDPDGAKIIMGNQRGGTDKFHVRSLFAFLSIGAALKDAADINRSISIQLKKGMPQQEFNRLENDVSELIDGKFSGRMIARTVSLTHVILRNIRVFTDALVSNTGDRRLSDTMAPYLAGYAVLRSRKIIAPAEALKIVSGHKWISERIAAAKIEATPDHQRIIARIMETFVQHGAQTFSVSELVDSCMGPSDGNVSMTQTLKRHGLRVQLVGDTWCLWIARNHTKLNEIFRNSEWSTTWTQVMRDGYGDAMRDIKSQRFGGETAPDLNPKRTLEIDLKSL